MSTKCRLQFTICITILCKEFCPLLHCSRCAKCYFYTDLRAGKAPVWLEDFRAVFFIRFVFDICYEIDKYKYKMIKINVSWVGQSITVGSAMAHFHEMHLSNMKCIFQIRWKKMHKTVIFQKEKQMTQMIWFLHITKSNMMIFRWNILKWFWIKSNSSFVTLQWNEKFGYILRLRYSNWLKYNIFASIWLWVSYSWYG